MKRNLIHCLVHILLVLFLAINFAKAQDGALGSDVSSDKLEAILLFDSSGSMLSTDPLRLRDDGAKLFIQSLKAGDKLGVIEFSGSAKIVQDFSSFKPEENKNTFENISKIRNEGIYTDLLSGIKLAKEIFKKDLSGDSNKVIILFSDGKMEPDPANATAENQINELFNKHLPELKAAGIKVHTLALSNKSDKDLLARIADSTEGIGIYAADANEIHQAFTNLFLAVKKPQVLPLTSKGFKIDGDVQEATFYINKEGESEISISSPAGKRFNKNSTDPAVKWFSSKKFDVVTIFEPEAGDWSVEGMLNQDGFATLLTNLQLVNDWPSNTAADEERLLQVRLYEDDKPVVLHGMTGALEYAFQVVPTDKISEPIIKDFLNDEGKDGDKIANDGIFSKNIKVEDPGQYKLKIVAHSPTFDRYQHVPFQVKERMITLSVESLESETNDTHSKDSHGSTEHHEDSHGDKHDEKDSHG